VLQVKIGIAAGEIHILIIGNDEERTYIEVTRILLKTFIDIGLNTSLITFIASIVIPPPTVVAGGIIFYP